MRQIFKNAPNMVQYFGDILVHTITFKEHRHALRKVLAVLRSNNLTAKPTKTEIAKTFLVFLGHTIKEGHIGPDESNITQILQLKPPTTKRQVRQLIIRVNYYNHFIRDYSQLMSPLTDLLNGVPTWRKIKWNLNANKLLTPSRTNLEQSQCSLHQTSKKPFVLATDCSAVGCGICLKQCKGDKLHPGFYGSEKLIPTEQKMSCIEWELYAMFLGVLRFKKYLLGHFSR